MEYIFTEKHGNCNMIRAITRCLYQKGLPPKFKLVSVSASLTHRPFAVFDWRLPFEAIDGIT